MAKPANFVFDMGDLVEDVITGATGFITTRAEHMTGCNTYLITPRKKKGDNSVSEYQSHSCDENRLKLIKKAAVKLPEREPEPETPRERTRGAMPGLRPTSQLG